MQAFSLSLLMEVPMQMIRPMILFCTLGVLASIGFVSPAKSAARRRRSISRSSNTVT